MQRLFISDLHLSADHPRLVRGFVDLVKASIGHVQQLYILGDWFETWIGDDDDATWLNDITTPLAQLHQSGCRIVVLHGNRDFLLGSGFLARFGGELCTDVIMLDTPVQRIRLEHGDALCTDDVKYQAFRSMSRDPAWQQGMLSQPLEQRRQIAQLMRMQSQMNAANTPENIMDVNAAAVAEALHDADVLLHGHTHRPLTHHLPHGKQRMVLGDWREALGEAVIARQTDDQPVVLELWQF